MKEIVTTEQRAVIPTNIFKKQNKVMRFEKIPTRVISPNLSFLGETVQAVAVKTEKTSKGRNSLKKQK